jgi:hypothetical protein
MRSRLRCAFAILLSLTTLPALRVQADEGMWPFNQVPRDEIRKRYGFDVSDAWLERVRMASVRFSSGGSGSFVSPDGLVLTNHHIALDALQKLSSAQKNYATEGFSAKTRAEEIKAPDLAIEVLLAIEDVTDRVKAAAAAKPGMDPDAARRAVLDDLRGETKNSPGLTTDVVTQFRGEQYHLYRYKRYSDVRLVFAPEYAIAQFGGDADNFNFPRYAFDITLFRVYENDKPLKAENYFGVSRTGPQADELLFVTGHPASSSRLTIKPHLDHLANSTYPLYLKRLDHMRAALAHYGEQGSEQHARITSGLFDIENGMKAMEGWRDALQSKYLVDKKSADEDRIRRQLKQHPEEEKEFNQAYGEITKAYESLDQFERDYYLLDGGWAFDSDLFLAARIITRIATESLKPNEERMPAFTDQRRSGLLQFLYSPGPVFADFEKARLTGSLRFMLESLGAGHPLVLKILRGKTPEARAVELIDGSSLKDADFRKKLVEGGVCSLEQTTDLLVMLARDIEPETRALRKRYETDINAVEGPAYQRIARALFRARGSQGYPDANSAWRLSYGVVRKYKEGSRTIAPFTDFKGLFEHAERHAGQKDYQLPARWSANKSNLNASTPFNFVSTHDIALGSSGSPVINRSAELVGLIFDLNHEALGGNFLYDDTQARSISLDVRAMLEALRKVYGADALVEELSRHENGGSAAPAALATPAGRTKRQ